MPSKIEISDVRAILAQVKTGRLKDALETARHCAEVLGLWQQLGTIATHERTYRAVAQFMEKESDPVGRHRALSGIKEDLLRLADAVRLEINLNNPRPGAESDIYYSTLRTRRFNPKSAAIPQLLLDISLTAGSGELYGLIDNLFMTVLTTLHLSANETESIIRFLDDESSDPDAVAMLISALGLANLYFYDRAKLMLLTRRQSDRNASVAARRLTGIYLTLWRHPSRISLDPEMGERIMTLLDDDANVAAFRKIAMAMLASRDTQRISEKMEKDIIPGLQQLQSDLQKRFPKQADVSDFLDPEKNPEWEEILSGSPLNDSLREISEMQAQGGDVMMLAFSNLKNFEFFRHLGNWILPYSPSHPVLQKAAEKNLSLLELIDDTADFLCDPDKYSLGLAMERLPGTQGDMMVDQLQAQFNQYREDKATSLSKDTEPEVNLQITLYIRSLSRLIKQFPHRGFRMPDPFAKAILPSEMPWIQQKLSSKGDLKVVSEFLFSRSYYSEALPVLKALEKFEPESSSLLEKIGFALQQTGQAAQAMTYYRLAETYSTRPSNWLLRKLATLHRANGDFAEAGRYWKLLAAEKPEDARVTLQLANALFEAGDMEQALKNYYKADYLAGGSERTWRPVAWCEFVLGNYDKSQTYYDRLLATTDDASDWLNAGHLALARGRLSNAIELYSRASKLHPEGIEGIIAQLGNDAGILNSCGLDEEAQALLADRLRFFN